MDLTRDDIENALTELGRRAGDEGRTIDIAVYGGSALMLASNFRIATGDVDAVATFEQDTVNRLAKAIASERGWSPDWLNDGVRVYLSPNVDGTTEHHALFRSYPDEAHPGLRVYIPTPEYMLAMKLNALRVGGNQPAKDRDDIKNLLAICNITTSIEAISYLAKFYPEYEPGSRHRPQRLARIAAFFAEGVTPAVAPTYDAANSAAATLRQDSIPQDRDTGSDRS